MNVTKAATERDDGELLYFFDLCKVNLALQEMAQRLVGACFAKIGF
jgi:hypothetical protein